MTRIEGIIRRLLIAVSVFCILASAVCAVGAYNGANTGKRLQAEAEATYMKSLACLKEGTAHPWECYQLRDDSALKDQTATSMLRDASDKKVFTWLWPIVALTLWLTFFLLRWILTGSVRPVVTRSVGP